MMEWRDSELDVDQLRVLALDDVIEGDVADSAISVDPWGNEWDSGAEFSDMDFRMVDE